MSEKLLNAVNHFGELENEPYICVTVDESDMSHSDNKIKIGSHTIIPKNSGCPKRITIDIDPKYPHILIRIINFQI